MPNNTTARKRQRAAKANYSAPALDKGLDILELFSGEDGSLSLSDIAQRLNRSVGEIFRMLAVLERRQYLSFDMETERYHLTLKMFELAHRHAPVKRLTAAALPVMRKLAQQLEQSCHLVVYHEGRGLVVAQSESPAARGFNVRLGAEAPLIHSCSGHLLLAFADRRSRAGMLKAQPRHLKAALSRDELDRIISKINKQGYEDIPSSQIQGVKDIGFPVFDYSEKMVAALSIPFLEHLDDSQKATFDEARDVLRNAAATISAALGYTETLV